MEVTADLVEAMERNDTSILDQETEQTLTDLGFLIVGEDSELKRYLDRYEESKIRGGRLSLKVFLATGCNLGCPYCYQSAPNRPKDVISDEMLDRLHVWLDKECRDGTPAIDLEFYGGEPLLARRSLVGFIEKLSGAAIAYGTSINYSIITNATLLNDTLINLFKRHKVHMQITVDGGAETHDARRFFKGTKKGSFDLIVQKLERIAELGAVDLIRLRMNVDAQNISDIEPVATLARRLGIMDFSAARVHFREKAVSYPHMIDPDRENPLEENPPELEMFRVMARYGYADSPASLESKTTCMYHWERGFAVSQSMHLFKCDELIDHPEHSVGFINESGELVLNYAAHRQAVERKPTDFEHCTSCRYLPQCGSGCSIRALNTKGTPHENYCEETYASIKRKIELYLRAEAEGLIPESGSVGCSHCSCS